MEWVRSGTWEACHLRAAHWRGPTPLCEIQRKTAPACVGNRAVDRNCFDYVDNHVGLQRD